MAGRRSAGRPPAKQPVESTLLICTDEAGYGPTLGPLVVCATAWRITDAKLLRQIGKRDDDHQRVVEILADEFTPMSRPIPVDRFTVQVDDSKAIFKSRKPGGLSALHAVFQATTKLVGLQDACTFDEALEKFCPDDIDAIRRTDWLCEVNKAPREPAAWVEPTDEGQASILNQWRESRVQLIDVGLRVVTAAEFNQGCSKAGNKADLLAESTLALAVDLMRKHVAVNEPALAFCDRFGGRRYYTGPVQQHFECDVVHPIEESRKLSRYQFETSHVHGQIAFTVKGDRFTPVAYSSLIAKYTRERMMLRLNDYFRRLWDESRAEKFDVIAPLRPTAGYPQDAQRFLGEIDELITAKGLDRERLVRCR